MFKSEQINELSAALAKAQSEMESAKKDSKAHSYNYSDLASVIAAAKPSLAKNGLSFTQLIEESEKGQVKVTTMLLHSSGQFIGSTGSLDVPEMRGVNDAQRAGAAQSYLKRYQLQSLVGLPSEDNDCSTDSRPIADAKVVTQASTQAVQSAPPKLTDEQAKATAKAPSFSRNKTTSTAKSNDLGI
jgi:cellobiose-specific phosphotransferase system component IIA